MNFSERHQSQTISKSFNVQDPEPMPMEHVPKPIYPDTVTVTYTDLEDPQGWAVSALVVGHTVYANGLIHETGWVDHFVGVDLMPEWLRDLTVNHKPPLPPDPNRRPPIPHWHSGDVGGPRRECLADDCASWISAP